MDRVELIEDVGPIPAGYCGTVANRLQGRVLLERRGDQGPESLEIVVLIVRIDRDEECEALEPPVSIVVSEALVTNCRCPP